MRKKAMAILLTAAIVVSMLTGCGQAGGDSRETAANNAANEPANAGGSDTEGGSGTEDGNGAGGDSGAASAIDNLIAATQGTVELTLWCEETPEYQGVMKEIVDRFETLYSDVDFDITIGSESVVDCKDDVLADVESAADLFIFPDDQLLDMVSAGALQRVDATYTYDPHVTNAASIVEAASVNGALYAYPLTASNGYFLFYDKNYLSEQDVSSWDNLLAACEAQGKKVGMEVSGAWYLYGFFAGAGLEMYRNDDGSNTCNWNATDTAYTGADVAAAVTEICKSPAMTNCGNDDMQAFSLNGEMIAAVNGTWSTTVFETAYGDGYAATKLPTFTVAGDQVQMGSFAGYKFLGVNAYSENTGWAMLLAEFITSQESQEAIGSATGEGPANLVAASSEEIASLPALAALAEQSQFADLQQVGDNYWGPAATLGENLVEGNYTDAQKLLDEAVEGITQPVAMD